MTGFETAVVNQIAVTAGATIRVDVHLGRWAGSRRRSRCNPRTIRCRLKTPRSRQASRTRWSTTFRWWWEGQSEGLSIWSLPSGGEERDAMLALGGGQGASYRGIRRHFGGYKPAGNRQKDGSLRLRSKRSPSFPWIRTASRPNSGRPAAA